MSEIEFKGGRLPPVPDAPSLKLSKYLSDATAPTHVDYLSNVSSWPMYLNDRIGDCTCAAAGHIVQALSTYGQGATQTVTDDDVLSAYEAVTGYDPNDPRTDRGAIMQKILSYWRKTGLGGHKILAFAKVDHTNRDEIVKALAAGGTVYLGINFPASGMDQFNHGQPWDVVPGSQIEGGHAINAGYFDLESLQWKVVTWGQVQPMTQGFFDAYVEEAWMVIGPEWLNTATGLTPEGIDLHALGEDFAALTGESNPFPEAPTPTPSPSPEPTPEPSPVVDPDMELAEVAVTWLEAHPYFYRPMQTAVLKWLADKGLP